MKTRCRELIEFGDKLFNKRSRMMSMWQEVAENFYPERADFLSEREIGDEFASNLATSYPIMVRRDLANQFSAMLRPTQTLWAKLRANDDRINEDNDARAWLDDKSQIMRTAMYEQHAQFVRATKEGDNDFAAFGQTVLEPSLRSRRDGLLYRCWHLRDVAWCEDADLAVSHVHRRGKQPAIVLRRLFGDRCSDAVKKAADKDPYREFECRHVVIPADEYDLDKVKNKERFPFVSLYLDKDNDTVLEEVPRKRLGYVIPRWQTVSGSQYSVSPATVAALPDARLIQSMSLALLEAGEKAATPPMIATKEVVRSDLALYAGGVTWVDQEYDERLGEALRPISQQANGISYGLEMLRDVREMLKEAFYLNRITLPDIGKDMTAFEVSKRVEEYIRAARPLFEPMESQYNGGICEETFEILLENGAFGSSDDMPDILRGADVKFQFESPLQATSDRLKSQAFQETAQLLQIAATIDPGAIEEIDIRKAFRDAVDGIQAPATWKRSPEDVAQREQAKQQAMAMAQAAQSVGQGAQVASQVGDAMNSLGTGAKAMVSEVA